MGKQNCLYFHTEKFKGWMTGPVTWEARPFKQLPQKDIQILVLHFFWCYSFLQLCLDKWELNYHFRF